MAAKIGKKINLPTEIVLNIMNINKMRDKYEKDLRKHKELFKCVLLSIIYLSRDQLLKCEKAIFKGFHRKGECINNEIHHNSVDWHGNYFIKPYINKECYILNEDDEDYSIECEFNECDMEGNEIDDDENIGLHTVELSIQFKETSGGLIDFDPIFERIA